MVRTQPASSSARRQFLSGQHYLCRFDPTTFALGERNGVCATGLEHKMGLKASPTCELTFGAHGRPAVGYLVGDVHNGIAQMFTVIEHARMTIG